MSHVLDTIRALRKLADDLQETYKHAFDRLPHENLDVAGAWRTLRDIAGGDAYIEISPSIVQYSSEDEIGLTWKIYVGRCEGHGNGAYYQGSTLADVVRKVMGVLRPAAPASDDPIVEIQEALASPPY